MDAIYARQSIDKKESISIETQIELCKKHLLCSDEFEIYFDKGYSGSNMNRPEFMRLLCDARDGKISRIITYRLDRISRSVLDFANLFNEFQKNEIAFISTQEQFDTTTVMGKAMLNIAMVFAQMERETIQQRITDNYYARGEKGMYLGGPPPFGFQKTEMMGGTSKIKLLEPEPETSKTLQLIYIMYGNELYSLGEISKWLNDKQIPSPGGRSWDSSKVSRVLRNPVSVKADADVYNYYRKKGCKFTNAISDFGAEKGCYLYGKREAHERKYTDVKNHTLSLAPHDGIIDSGLFLRCQERMDKNSQIDNKRSSQITWLSGLIKCGKCGYSVIPKSSNSGRYRYLYCTGRTVHSVCDVDSNLGSLTDVEGVVRDRIFKWAERYSDLKANIEQTTNKERNNLNIKIGEIDIQIQKLIDLAVSANSITAEYLNDRISSLSEERCLLEKETDKISGKREVVLKKEIADLSDEWEGLDIRQKNTIVSLLVSRINIIQNEIEIVWKYDFS